MSALTLTIPELSGNQYEQNNNYPWFNNYIAAILYSQYSRELIYTDGNILEKLKEIFKFKNDTIILIIINIIKYIKYF